MSIMTDKDKHRRETYNATIIEIKAIHDNLAVFKIKPDEAPAEFEAGQFVNIGLFNFEEPRLTAYDNDKLIKRPYSVSSPLLNPDADLFDFKYADFYELYIAQVPAGELTPKLFNLKENDRIYITNKALGHYVMPKINSNDTVIFASTGTGLAPHNAMLVDMLNRLHKGKIIVFDCVRYIADLAYKKLLEELVSRFDNLIYIPLTTRESDKKQYIQDFFKNDLLKKDYNITINAKDTHVFCCGNPSMIGIPKKNRETGDYEFPTENGLVELLMKNYNLSVFRKDVGNIHFEKYW